MNIRKEISQARTVKFKATNELEEIREKLLVNLEFHLAGKEMPYDPEELHTQAQAIRDRQRKAGNNLSVEAALRAKDVFSEWESSRAYEAGDRFLYNGNLYECIEANPVNPTWTPDVTYTYYKPVARADESGTIYNPVTAVIGMEYEVGKYYSEDGKIYLCKRDGMTEGDKITLYYLPSALVGSYFEIV
jgi:hypothetical protein